MDDHRPNDVPRHQKFEPQQDCSSQVLTTNTIGIQSIGLAFYEKTGRCDDRSCNNQADFTVGGRPRICASPERAASRMCWEGRCLKAQANFAGLWLKRGIDTGMEPENLDIEQIHEDRRKAIQGNIEVISMDDLKASEKSCFPTPTIPGRRSSSNSSSSIPATHAITPPQMIG